jgi:hypothetical protein
VYQTKTLCSLFLSDMNALDVWIINNTASEQWHINEESKVGRQTGWVSN